MERLVTTGRTVGIIGLGNFGQFLASHLRKDKTIRVIGCDPHNTAPVAGVELAQLAEVAQADVVVLAVPLNSYAIVLPTLAPHLSPETLVMDVCSVKVYPTELFAKHLPGHKNILLTHPLFGPQSAAESMQGHTLIVTAAEGARAQRVLDYCKDTLGVEVKHLTPEEHDKVMGRIHVLTFFLARGLANLNLEDVPFITPSYRMITDLVAFDKSHTDELFQTIQQGNPYADEIRQAFVQTFAQLEKDLTNG